MYFTPRRRAFIAVLVAWPLAWIWVDVAWQLVYNVLQVLHRHTGFVTCGSGLPRLVSSFNGCNDLHYQWGYALLELVLLVGIAGAVGYGLARWVSQPIREVAETISQFGPNSLGLRIRSRGPRDEARELSDAIDAMLDRLAAGYEAQRRFASNASHELRTPLATQRALIEVSLSSALTEDQLQLLSRQLLATNERNEALVDGLLTLAETDRGLVVSTALRLDYVIAEVVETLQRSAKAHDVELSAALAPVSVIGEQPLLDRLATNLIGNAIKYNRPGGTVIVTVTQGGRFTVANTGPDIAPEAVAGLFEPFHRMSGERLDHGGGVGLGLTIARSIVAAHRGSIEARPNQSGGGGLVVDVTLPLA